MKKHKFVIKHFPDTPTTISEHFNLPGNTIQDFSFMPFGTVPDHRYLGSVIFAFETTLTPTHNHITCINTFGQGFKKDAIRYQCSLY